MITQLLIGSERGGVVGGIADMDGGCGSFWSGVAVTQVSCMLVRLVDFMGRARVESLQWWRWCVSLLCFLRVTGTSCGVFWPSLTSPAYNLASRSTNRRCETAGVWCLHSSSRVLVAGDASCGAPCNKTVHNTACLAGAHAAACVRRVRTGCQRQQNPHIGKTV